MKALSVSLTRRTLLLSAFEALLIVGAVSLAAWIRLGNDAWHMLFVEGDIRKAIVIALVCQMCLYYLDLYHLRVVSDRRELFTRVVQALGVASLALAAVYFLVPSLVIGRGVFVVSSILVFVGVVGGRVAFGWLTSQVAPRQRLLIVGTGTAAVSLARELYEERQQLGVEIVGFVDVDPAKVGMPLINPAIIGTIDDIPSIVRARAVDRVVISLSDARGKLPMDKLLEMKLDGVSFDHLASVYEEMTGKIAVENLRPSWLIFSSGFKKGRFLHTTKRLVDIVAATVGLVLASPVMAIVAVASKITSSGPILYRQQRVGQHGKVFTLYKFRSMRPDAEASTGAVWAQQNDDRVTALGRLLRKARLDELPQLWNVLKGDMSLVGPRPERPEFIRQLTTQIPFYGQRHVVRPGLTGWAQVRYTYGASVEDAMQKLQYDLFYIKHLSLGFDLFIVFGTIKTVVLRRGT